jgi:HNH/ENDO VII superfamily nuclease with conserved GHE residues
VFDPNRPIELKWDPSLSRNGQWDMGHKYGYEYKALQRRYMNGHINLNEFLAEYRNPNNYRPEHPSSNRSRAHDKN